MSYSGAGKDEFCDRLGNDWKSLADRLEIPTAAQRQFPPGDEGRAIWAWLEQRGRLSALPATLAAIGRGELATVLVERQRTDARRYYQNRIDFWSQERFKLDRRFVRLTLWLDQGEDAAGQRWQAQPRQFENLQDVLTAARDYPALVLLGPPGSGKTTLLGHLELDYARQALAQPDTDLTTAPLTFFISLNLYQAEKPGAPPCPLLKTGWRSNGATAVPICRRWTPCCKSNGCCCYSKTRFDPAQPVVGISWHEARAYCAWLSAQTGLSFRLPTEAEWEAAARGKEGRRYAYGNNHDPRRCNTFETHIRRTTPIGIFPGGETPEGAVDLTGNTWDWTSSLYHSYPYNPSDGREDLETDDRRVARGGSWADSSIGARAASRNRSHPGGRYGRLGVRVVVGPSPIFSKH